MNASSANHIPACCAPHPTYCCKIDTTAINQGTQITRSLQHRDCSQPEQGKCEAEKQSCLRQCV